MSFHGTPTFLFYNQKSLPPPREFSAGAAGSVSLEPRDSPTIVDTM